MIKLHKSNRQLRESTLQHANNSLEALLARKDLGFFKLPQRDKVWESCAQRSLQIQNLFDHFVFIGIGGSGLGGRAIVHAMQYCYPAEKISFLENVDPLTISNLLASKTHFKKTHWCLISKSGSTLETLSVANRINEHLEKQGLNLSDCCTVISESKESPLTKWAKSSGVPILVIDFDIGGRFSVLSPVGLLPASCLGVDLDKLRSGAFWALEQKELICQLVAHSIESFERQEFITQFWFYADGLKVFSEWVMQLWAESLAKKQTLDGMPAPRVSTPMGCVGAIDQHSILQQVMEGARDKMIWMSRVKSVEAGGEPTMNIFSDFSFLDTKSIGDVLAAEASGMYSAYVKEDISVLEVQWQDLSPECLAAGFMIFELVVGALGQALNINAFDQPGVELGKKLAKKVLALHKI